METFRYTLEELDQLCSLTVNDIQSCAVSLLQRMASDFGISGAWKMKKDQLCSTVKQAVSLRNSEQLLKKCDASIKLVETAYDPKVHGSDIGKTINQLRQWYNTKYQKITDMKKDKNSSIFSLSSEFAEINTQCKNLTFAVGDEMMTKNKKPFKKRQLFGKTKGGRDQFIVRRN